MRLTPSDLKKCSATSSFKMFREAWLTTTLMQLSFDDIFRLYFRSYPTLPCVYSTILGCPRLIRDDGGWLIPRTPPLMRPAALLKYMLQASEIRRKSDCQQEKADRGVLGGELRFTELAFQDPACKFLHRPVFCAEFGWRRSSRCARSEREGILFLRPQDVLSG